MAEKRKPRSVRIPGDDIAFFMDLCNRLFCYRKCVSVEFREVLPKKQKAVKRGK